MSESTISRRALFVAAGAAGIAAGGNFAARAASPSPQTSAPGAPAAVGPDFPRQDVAAVRDIVTVAHVDLEQVKALIEKRPALVNATWDWGFGDWETPLGAAAHVGRRNIAEYLLSRGARLDLFAATMLGQLDVVRGMIVASPGLQKTRGPHGISLLSHAKAGGDAAAAVRAYLESLGDADHNDKPSKASAGAGQAYIGTYSFGPGAEDRLVISANQSDFLQFKREGGTSRFLFSIGEHEFHPNAAPAVRIRFELRDGTAVRVVVTDGDTVVTAARV